MESITVTSALSLLVSIIVVAFGKYVMPWLWEKLTGKKDKDSAIHDIVRHLEEKTVKLETNHLVHIAQDIDEMKRQVNDIYKTQIEHGNRLTRVETKIEGNMYGK